MNYKQKRLKEFRKQFGLGKYLKLINKEIELFLSDTIDQVKGCERERIKREILLWFSKLPLKKEQKINEDISNLLASLENKDK